MNYAWLLVSLCADFNARVDAFATYNGMIYGEPRYSAAHAQPASSTVCSVTIDTLCIYAVTVVPESRIGI